MIDLKNIKRFTTLMQKTYTFNQKEYDNNPKWRILWNLYNQNFILAEKSVSRLPKKIHQIWLGSKFPEKYREWANSWKRFNPKWDYKLWTDEDLQESCVHISNWELFNSIKNMGQKSDYLRYCILNQFGGLYVDTDFECLKSFDSLCYVKFLTGIVYSYVTPPVLNNALIGSIPNHPILQRIIDVLATAQDITTRHVMSSTGPYFFTKRFFEVIGSCMEGVVALPPGYFYPFPNERGFENKRKDGKNYAEDYSYAIHYWEVSWVKKKK